jgi:hypothetical protein
MGRQGFRRVGGIERRGQQAAQKIRRFLRKTHDLSSPAIADQDRMTARAITAFSRRW